MIESSIRSLPRLTIEVRCAADMQDRQLCLDIRFKVFVDEQQVAPELELDEYDDQSRHYLAFAGEEAIGTARLIPKGSIAKIGRVAILKEFRGLGVGYSLMEYVLEDAVQAGFSEAVLDSQTYAIPFYARLGFVAEGEEFLDADIPHYLMRMQLTQGGAAAS